MKEYLKSREFVSVALVSTQVNEEIIQKLKQFFCKIELDVYPTTDFVFSADALWNLKKKQKKQNKSKKNCHLKTVHYVMACSQVKVKNKNKFFWGVTAAPPLKSKENPKFVSLSLKL